MRTRIALSLGALLLAGGAAFATTSLASADQSAPSPTTSQPPAKAPTVAPAEPTRATTAPSGPEAAPTKANGTVVKPGEHRVPKAVPAGPTGDLNLPAVVEGAGD